MILVKIHGGLGNQMFQYALGRALSIIKKAEVKYDVKFYETTPNRHYALDVFNTEIFFTDEYTRKKMAHPSSFRKAIDKILPFSMRRRIVETTMHPYNKKIFVIGAKCYINGFWQTEKYFKPIEDVIRKDFTLRRRLGEDAQAIEAEIRSKTNTISVHVRRGDYAISKKIQAIHGNCSPAYYNQAFEILHSKLENPHYFVFSDDIDWVKTNIRFHENTTFVSERKTEDYEDLHLMSLCQHNIIANSSFSWWGAWLNQNPDKIVIAPQKWFNVPYVDTRDLIPEGWLKI